MSNSKRPKAFFLNGGMGRIISAIPALEKYYEAKEDPDFIIVIEGICNIMNGHPTLDNKTYDMYHKNLFHTKLINMDIVSPEPYRLNEYFNQKCDIAQAFDMLINKKGIRELPAPTLILSKEELLEGRKAIDEIKKKVKKEKLVIIQPFGRAITQIDNSFVDKSNRSIEFSNLKQIIKKLQEKDWAVCIMSEFGIEFKDAGFKDEVAIPEIPDLRKWAGLIKYADHFLGCDSVGQHLAKAMETPASVVMGATYPINTSYPNDKNFTIIDMGQFDREYDPIRISFDERISRKHERIMTMTPEIEDYVVSAVNGDPIEE
jgi:hypothetical protein|tara:strand:- start:187 stop:1137 length:951 start_codon:yes stop_codon:yes gene_type:complete